MAELPAEKLLQNFLDFAKTIVGAKRLQDVLSLSTLEAYSLLICEIYLTYIVDNQIGISDNSDLKKPAEDLQRLVKELLNKILIRTLEASKGHVVKKDLFSHLSQVSLALAVFQGGKGELLEQFKRQSNVGEMIFRSQRISSFVEIREMMNMEEPYEGGLLEFINESLDSVVEKKY